jgi:hypothetical protein
MLVLGCLTRTFAHHQGSSHIHHIPLVLFENLPKNGTGLGSSAPYTDYPLTGLLPRNAPTGISRPQRVCPY